MLTLASNAPALAPPPVLPMLAGAIQQALDRALPERLPMAVGEALRRHARLDGLLDDGQRQGNADRYTRHILYAHPAGLFTVVGLVWQPGQMSPVHGHHTWCSYMVLQGDMHEEHFAWHAGQQCAEKIGEVRIGAGDCVASQAGVQDIHRLRNAGDSVAISLHVYGVDAQRVATHVNRVIPLA